MGLDVRPELATYVCSLDEGERRVVALVTVCTQPIAAQA